MTKNVLVFVNTAKQENVLLKNHIQDKFSILKDYS